MFHRRKFKICLAVWGLLVLIIAGSCGSKYPETPTETKFVNRTGVFSVTVYPVNIVIGDSIACDSMLAVKIAEFLKKEGLAEPSLGPVLLAPLKKWEGNQMRLSEHASSAFAAHLRQASIQTEYALLVQILCRPSDAKVVGVQYFLRDRQGSSVDGKISNNYFKEFREVDPKDPPGGCEVAIRMMRQHWKLK
jgi:hypothetical protein